jgi:hypothetical protein
VLDEPDVVVDLALLEVEDDDPQAASTIELMEMIDAIAKWLALNLDIKLTP